MVVVPALKVCIEWNGNTRHCYASSGCLVFPLVAQFHRASVNSICAPEVSLVQGLSSLVLVHRHPYLVVVSWNFTWAMLRVCVCVKHGVKLDLTTSII